ncbi:MAG: TonB-dependent receptor plug domain-containing protein, partial [Phenylobacterium sp.]
MKAVLFTAAAAAALLAAMPAFANDADGMVEELIVTARAGAEQRKVEASYAITTIGEEKLRMQSPVSVAEALKNVPGFWVEASGGEAGANIRARGIPMEGYSAIAMQEDGTPIQHDGGLGFLNSDFSFRMDETVQRMEVVRGGPSSIFTSYAPGGVVNFITRKGSDQFEGLVKAQVGDYGLARGDFWVGGPVAGFRVGLGGFYRVSDGVRDPGYRADEGGQIRLSIGRDFERGSIDFNVKHLDDNTIFFLG